MALSASARVNEKLYHARLLHDMAQSAAADSVAQAAAKLALQHAAVHAAYAAFQLFVREISESVKIKTRIETLQDLQAELKKEGRSHAVAETLAQQLVSQGSWLQQLQKAQDKTLFLHAAEVASHNNPLAVKQMDGDDEDLSLAHILQQFHAFLLEQRSYLQEW